VAASGISSVVACIIKKLDLAKSIPIITFFSTTQSTSPALVLRTFLHFNFVTVTARTVQAASAQCSELFATSSLSEDIQEREAAVWRERSRHFIEDFIFESGGTVVSSVAVQKSLYQTIL